MDGWNWSIKKFTLHKRKVWLNLILQNKSAQFKKMNSQSIFLSLNKITHYFKECTTANGALTKLWCFKQILLTVAVPKNCSTPIENSGYKYFKRAALWRKQLLPKSPLQVQMCTIALLKNLLYLISNCNCCCEIVKL